MIRPDISARRIGHEQQPVAIVDGFHPDPDALRALAAKAAFGPAHRHYPGIRADLPGDYFAAVRPALALVLREVFAAERIDLLDASFSIVTAAPDTLVLEQRLPHVDAIVPGRIALVHYLSPTETDGTAFFRHRATGFETIDEARSAAYLAALDGELTAGAMPPAAYTSGSTDLFEEVWRADARYNRAVIYRSALLHSGAISPGARLDANPATGRLTVTAFLSA